jgi:16S rRNA (guanine966-N2)-methyltransferase
MRIISGAYRGRRLSPPTGLPVRPTTDFAKEGLFNVLNGMVDFYETRVLDLYEGTGNMSFEFISRGCPEVMAVDIEHRCAAYIGETARDLGMQGLTAIRSNVIVFLEHPRKQYDLVFADPPYQMHGIRELPQLILASGLLRPGGLLVLEHSSRYKFTGDPGFREQRGYGSVQFSLFGMKNEGETD